jgi:hypothetical protein
MFGPKEDEENKKKYITETEDGDPNNSYETPSTDSGYDDSDSGYNDANKNSGGWICW